MKTLLFFLLMVLPSILPAADGPRVMMVRGNVSIQQQGKTISAAAGMKLATSAVIEVGPSSYVAILKGGSGVVELSATGKYKLESLFAGVKKTAITQRIVSYLYANAYGKRSTGSETGTVYRAQSITATWPPDIVVDTSTLTLRWNPLRNHSGGYLVRLSTENDSVVKEIRTHDTLAVLDLQAIGRSYRGTCLYWTVSSGNDSTFSSLPRCVLWATDEEIRTVSMQASELLSVYTVESTTQIAPLQGILLGSLYEEQGYYERALEYYAKGSQGTDAPEIKALHQFCQQRGRE